MIIYYVDECHLCWGDVCGYVWGPKNERIELKIKNIRDKQTYYGAINGQSGEVIVNGYKTANSENTVDFLEYLRSLNPGCRIIIFWDGASYHRQKEMPTYLERVNSECEPKQWPIRCILFAPYAPEQNPIEDIWLKAKNFARKQYGAGDSFKQVKQLFLEAIGGKFFDFPKLHMYTSDLQMI